MKTVGALFLGMLAGFIVGNEAGTAAELQQKLDYYKKFSQCDIPGRCDPRCTPLCRFEGFRLPSRNVSILTVSSSLECSQACHTHPDCTSINLDTTLNQCEINKEMEDVVIGDFEQNNNYQFWSKKVC